MPRFPVVVVGGSAGSIEALRAFLPTLPSGFPGAVAIAIHRQPIEEDERLPRVLAVGCRLPLTHALDDERIKSGHVYLCPPNVHLHIIGGRLHLGAGPKENGTRPAIDVLFRSAARAQGHMLASVLLSGVLDDGVAGVAAVKRHGGWTIAQDPNEALFADMPRNAIQNGVDAVLPVSRMASNLLEFFSGSPNGTLIGSSEKAGVTLEVATPSYACPACHGVLVERHRDGVPHYVCRTGHAYSEVTLQNENDAGVELAIWSAIRALEEQADLSDRIGRRYERQGTFKSAQRLIERAVLARQRAQAVRDALPTISSALEIAEEQPHPQIRPASQPQHS